MLETCRQYKSNNGLNFREIITAMVEQFLPSVVPPPERGPSVRQAPVRMPLGKQILAGSRKSNRIAFEPNEQVQEDDPFENGS